MSLVVLALLIIRFIEKWIQTLKHIFPFCLLSLFRTDVFSQFLLDRARALADPVFLPPHALQRQAQTFNQNLAESRQARRRTFKQNLAESRSARTRFANDPIDIGGERERGIAIKGSPGRLPCVDPAPTGPSGKRLSMNGQRCP